MVVQVSLSSESRFIFLPFSPFVPAPAQRAPAAVTPALRSRASAFALSISALSRSVFFVLGLPLLAFSEVSLSSSRPDPFGSALQQSAD